MDVFGGDPHTLAAVYCIAIAIFLTVVVQAGGLSDYYDEVKRGARRGKKSWQK